MSKCPEDYSWSSCSHYVGEKSAPDWLHREEILGHFDGDEQRYRRFVEDGQELGVTNPLAGALASTILGGKKLVKEIEALHLTGVIPTRDLPNLRQLRSCWSLDDINALVEKNLNSGKDFARKVSMYLCHRYSGAMLREIGERFDVGASAVSQGSRRMRIKITEDEALRGEVERLCRALGIVNV